MEGRVRRRRGLVIALLTAWLTPACGYLCDKTETFCEDEKTEEPVDAELLMTALDGQPFDQRLAFASAGSCDYDGESGLLRVKYPGEQKQLSFEVRDFTSTPRTYACAAAGNNNDESSHVGDGYDSCMVEVQVPNAEGRGFDTYAMYRASALVRRFAYDGACEIRVDSAVGRLTGVVSCSQMAQTGYAGLARNPVASDGIHADRTASFIGSFGCNLHAMTVPPKDTGDPDPPPPPKATSQIATSNGKTTTLVLPSASLCSTDPETGLFKAAFVGPKGQMELEVRDYRSGEGTYACRQAADNGIDSASIGDLYDSCMVEVRTSFGGSTALDGYSMHRRDPSIKRFTYDKSCSITVVERDGDAEGTVHCQGMAESMLGGIARNPIASDQIHADVTADVTAEFRCRISRPTTEEPQ